jgi:hypothetical protein
MRRTVHTEEQRCDPGPPDASPTAEHSMNFMCFTRTTPSQATAMPSHLAVNHGRRWHLSKLSTGSSTRDPRPRYFGRRIKRNDSTTLASLKQATAVMSYWRETLHGNMLTKFRRPVCRAPSISLNSVASWLGPIA